MKKKYLYNGQLIPEDVVMEGARQNGVDFNTYVQKSGMKAVDDSYSYNGQTVPSEVILQAANQQKLGFDDYIQKGGFQSLEKKNPIGKDLSNGQRPASYPLPQHPNTPTSGFKAQLNLGESNTQNIPAQSKGIQQPIQEDKNVTPAQFLLNTFGAKESDFTPDKVYNNAAQYIANDLDNHPTALKDVPFPDKFKEQVIKGDGNINIQNYTTQRLGEINQQQKDLSDKIAGELSKFTGTDKGKISEYRNQIDALEKQKNDLKTNASEINDVQAVTQTPVPTTPQGQTDYLRQIGRNVNRFNDPLGVANQEKNIKDGTNASRDKELVDTENLNNEQAGINAKKKQLDIAASSGQITKEDYDAEQANLQVAQSKLLANNPNAKPVIDRNILSKIIEDTRNSKPATESDPNKVKAFSGTLFHDLINYTPSEDEVQNAIKTAREQGYPISADEEKKYIADRAQIPGTSAFGNLVNSSLVSLTGAINEHNPFLSPQEIEGEKYRVERLFQPVQRQTNGAIGYVNQTANVVGTVLKWATLGKFLGGAADAALGSSVGAETAGGVSETLGGVRKLSEAQRNIAGTALTSGLLVYPEAKEEAKKFTDDESKQDAYAGTMTLLNTLAFTSLNPEGIVQNVVGKLGKSDFGKEFLKVVDDVGGINKIEPETFKQTLVKGFTKALGANASATATMTALNLATQATDVMFDKKPSIDTKELLNEAKNSFLSFAPISVLQGREALVNRNQRNIAVQMINEAAKDPIAFKDYMDNAVDAGQISRSDANKKISIVNSHASLKGASELPDYLSEENKAEYADNLRREFEIKQSIKNLPDETLLPEKEAQIKKLQQERKNILSQPNTENNAINTGNITESNQQQHQGTASGQDLSTNGSEVRKEESGQAIGSNSPQQSGEKQKEVNSSIGLSHGDWLDRNKDLFSTEKYNELNDGLTSDNPEIKQKAVDEIVAKKEQLKNEVSNTETQAGTTNEGTNKESQVAEKGNKTAPLNDAENKAIEAVKGIDFNTTDGKKVKIWTDVLQDDNASVENKRLALQELHQQLTDPNSEIPTGTGLGKAADAFYELPYKVEENTIKLTETKKSEPISKEQTVSSLVGKDNVEANDVVTKESVIPKDSEPFQFSYLRNKEKAPKMGERFGQHIEPAGKYVTVSDGEFAKGKSNFETGQMRFNKPLVIDFGGGYGEESNWKNVLSKRYNGKTGKELSNAIKKDGYDGIVTVSESSGKPYTSEIVALDPKEIKLKDNGVGVSSNSNEDVKASFADAKKEFDAIKEKYSKHLRKDGGLRVATPDSVKKEINDAYQKMQSLVKQEREKIVSEDKRDTGLVDGIERIKDNTSAINLVKLVMSRGYIPERQYNEFGKNLLHIVADTKDSHEVAIQTAEIIQEFTKRANVKVDDTAARELQAAENLKFEPENTQNTTENNATTEAHKGQGNPQVSDTESTKPTGEETGDKSGINEPPKPPDEGTQSEGSGSEGIKRAATKEAREKAGLEEFEKNNPNTHEGLLAEAKKAIKDNPNIANEVMDKIESGGEVTPQDNAILSEYKAALDYQLENNPSKDIFDKVNRLVKVLDPAGRKAGKLLESFKLTSAKEDNLSNFLIDKELAQGAPLTDKQFKEETAKYKELEKARNDFEAALNIEREKSAKLEAENSLLKLGKERKKQNKTHDEFKADRKSLVEKLKQQKAAQEKYLKDMGIQKQGFGITLTVDMIKTIGEIVKSHIDENIQKLESLVDKVFNDIKDVFPEVTKNDVIDVIGGKYDNIDNKPTQNQIANNTRLLKREAQLLSELSDAKKGEELAKTERGKREKTRRIEELEKKIKEVRQQNNENAEPIEQTNEQKIAARRKALLKRIDKLNEDLKNKNFLEEKPAAKPLKLDKKTQLLQDRVISLENKIKSERKLDEASKLSKWEKAWNKAQEYLGLRRILQTALDMSTLFRQLGTLAFNPRKWDVFQKSFKSAITTIFSQVRYDRVMNAIHTSPDFKETIEDGIRYNELDAVKPEERNELYPTNFIFKIKFLSEPIKASQRTADATLNTARYELYQKYKRMLLRRGVTRESDPEVYKEMAKLVMNNTGSGNLLGFLEGHKAEKVLGTTFYGARLMASNFNTLNPVYYGKILGKNKALGYEALKDIAAYTTTIMALGAGALAAGGKISMNPDDSDFLQIRFGDKVYDLTGGRAAYVRTFLRWVEVGYARATKSKFEQNKALDFASGSTLRFFRNKLSPNTGYVVSAIANKNSIGQPFDPYEPLELYPMYADDALKAAKADGFTSLLTVLMPNILGVGYSSYYSANDAGKQALENTLDRNMNSDEMNKDLIKNYNEDGRPITDKEFDNFVEKRDKYIEKSIKDLYDGKSPQNLVLENGEVVNKKYSEMSKEEIVSATSNIKREATNTAKEELFGKKEKKSDEDIKESYKLKKARSEMAKENTE